jgi:lysophospholipase L1-like esterase
MPLKHFVLSGLLAFGLTALAWAAPVSGNTTTAAPKPLRLVLIGDSTVCNYPANVTTRGWGQYLPDYFTSGVEVINLAKSGRSTKTFISEGLWKNALEQKPDIVLIQFGHNDSHTPDHPEATNAATDYRDFLRRYIDESRAAGAIPILVTPMCRRTFGPEGKLTDNLQPYADAMKVVAAEKKVPVIDLHASSAALYLKIGPAACLELANKSGDSTHFNEKGAQAMAQLVMQELPAAAPTLKGYLKPVPPTPVISSTAPNG